MSVELSVAEIGNLDEGRGARAINLAIKAAVADTEDRGDDGKPRKVVITITMEKDGPNIDVGLDVLVKAPAFKVAKTAGRISMKTGTAKVVFSPDSVTNPDQPRFPVEGEIEE